jgi:hypothetical protein
MTRTLPSADIVRRFLDEDFDSRVAVHVLNWSDETEHLWELPEGLSILAGPPRRFGFILRRTASQSYQVRLLWDRTQLHWANLSKMDLLGCCLGSLLAAVGVDLWGLLEQPILADSTRRKAA